jgi:predicted transcriptional regulator
MKRAEEVYRKILQKSMENKNNSFTQSELSKDLSMSLSLINLALKPLKKMGAIKVKRRGFSIVDKRKVLYYWASIRNIEKDIVYKTRADKPVKQIEAEMPDDIIYGAYSAYKFKFKKKEADYSEVYAYSDNIKEIEKRFPKNEKAPNLFVLKKDKNMKQMTLGLLFADLWNMKEWYAKDFLKALEEKIHGLLE